MALFSGRSGAWAWAGLIACGVCVASSNVGWADSEDDSDSSLSNSSQLSLGRTYQGEVDSTRGNSLIFSTEDGNQKSVNVSDNTHIRLNGKHADLSDLQPNDIVIIRLHPGSTSLARRITATRSSEVSGLARSGRGHRLSQSAYRPEQRRPDQLPSLGIGLELLSRTQQGVRVHEVIKDGPADEAGLRPGDQIVSVDGQNVSAPYQLIAMIHQSNPGDQIRLTILRNGREKTLKAEVAARPQVIHDDDLHLLEALRQGAAALGQQRAGRFDQMGSMGQQNFPGQAPFFSPERFSPQPGYGFQQGYQGPQQQQSGYQGGAGSYSGQGYDQSGYGSPQQSPGGYGPGSYRPNPQYDFEFERNFQ
jgi:hypothetical protein